MTKLSGPWDGPDYSEDFWRKMGQLWLPTGAVLDALNEMQVFADSTGMQVKVKTGRAWVKGHYFEDDAQETLPIAAADGTNPRIDRVILRADFVANSIDYAVKTGTPAATPSPPTLTQNTTSMWEMPLAQVRVNAAVGTITADKVTDERRLAGSDFTPGELLVSPGRVFATSSTFTTSTTPVDIAGLAGTFVVPPSGEIVMVFEGTSGAAGGTAGETMDVLLTDGFNTVLGSHSGLDADDSHSHRYSWALSALGPGPQVFKMRMNRNVGNGTPGFFGTFAGNPHVLSLHAEVL